MASFSPTLGGLTGGYASADFEDAEDLMPPGAAVDIGGNGLTSPYSLSLSAMVAKHMEEIDNKYIVALQPGVSWKKRLREFITQKNTTLLDFLALTPQSNTVLSKAETLLSRFGNPQVYPNHPSVREFVMDASGEIEPILTEIGAALDAARADCSGVRGHMLATEHLYEKYRAAGDALLHAQSSLKSKLDKLDRIQGRIANLFEIDPSEKFDPLIDATEKFLGQIYDKNQIAGDYKDLIAAYRRFAVYRDAVQMLRASTAIENEPICTICLNETVAYALVPCGHTFCPTCARRQLSSCPMCRIPIRERLKIYFG